ncbi:outer membrane lipoprotein [Candidatus Endolissoclinum faulkneri L2]|uniref:Outer membrane protein assembly factor BamD n=1 Tax=Candidatus Endolissoclinum faulkneri L2 TaxID=1193729 RepID=K7YNZ9_9PROT|nr:outer membrane protein assembly factor BamD [Candidatus Endolissoclinum faulkneri]AFX98329.1 outer membrane lipoprotein [Candidatus Endolissoclinum faulkneri L2]
MLLVERIANIASLTAITLRFFFVVLGSILSACSTKHTPKYVEQTVDELYNNAYNAALLGNFKKAASLFDEVERQHPYSVWANQAQIMSAYALYQSNKYDDALAALDRFIQLNPGNHNVDYALYLKGLCYYEQIVDVERDQKLTSEALSSFEELVKRFPNSKYARDANFKIDLALNHLAGQEMNIGRWYMRQGQYLSAINRFQHVITEFDTTEQLPEALMRMAECYMTLGLVEEAKRTISVLGYNDLGSKWYEHAYSLLNND